MKPLEKKIESLAKELHYWYLEAVEELSESSYNPEAKKPYEALTEEQKSIDRYIAREVLYTYFGKCECGNSNVIVSSKFCSECGGLIMTKLTPKREKE